MKNQNRKEIEKAGMKEVVKKVQEASEILRRLEKAEIAGAGHDNSHSCTFAHFALQLESFLSSDNDEAGLVPYFRTEYRIKAKVKFYEHKGIKVTIPED